jgi:hypothetical protein
MRIKIFICIVIALFSQLSDGLSQVSDSIVVIKEADIVAFQIGLGANLPAGDLADRYGGNLNFSLGGEYITKNDWMFVPEVFYFYGDNIKEDILKPYRSTEGFLLGDDQQEVDMTFSQRGLFLGLGAGKMWRTNTKNRSGVGLIIGGGLMAHKIKFSDTRNSFAQTRAGRDFGYDRLARGWSLKETISYKYFSTDRRLSFDFAFDFIQGFTSEVRKINFDTGLPTLQNRLDIMYGIRILWTLPYFKGGAERTIYY